MVPQRYDHQGEGGGSHRDQCFDLERSRSQRVQLKLDMDVVSERFCLHVLQG